MKEGRDPITDALEALCPVPPPEPQRWQEDRDAYIAEAHALAEEAANPKPAANPGPEASHHGWLAGFWAWLTLKGRQVPAGALLKAGIVLVLLLAGGAGTVRASRGSLPGSLLYPVKVRWEEWRLNAVREPGEEATRAMSMAQTRVEEARRLREKGEDVPDAVVVRYQTQIERAMTASDGLEEAQRAAVKAKIAEMVEAQIRETRELHEGDEDAEAETVREMIRAMEAVRDRVRDQDGKGASDGSTPPGQDEERPGLGLGRSDEDNGKAPGGPPTGDEADRGGDAGPPDNPGRGDENDDERPDSGPPSEPPGSGDKDEDNPGNGKDSGEPGLGNDEDEGDDEGSPGPPGQGEDDEDDEGDEPTPPGGPGQGNHDDDQDGSPPSGIPGSGEDEGDGD